MTSNAQAPSQKEGKKKARRCMYRAALVLKLFSKGKSHTSSFSISSVFPTQATSGCV